MQTSDGSPDRAISMERIDRSYLPPGSNPSHRLLKGGSWFEDKRREIRCKHWINIVVPMIAQSQVSMTCYISNSDLIRSGSRISQVPTHDAS